MLADPHLPLVAEDDYKELRLGWHGERQKGVVNRVEVFSSAFLSHEKFGHVFCEQRSTGTLKDLRSS